MTWWRPIGLGVLILVIGPFALKRVLELTKLVMAGSPNPERMQNIPQRLWYELVKVIGQKKLLQWSGPGLAHAFTFWGFLVIQIALAESVFEFFWAEASLPIIGKMAWLGAVFDFFVLAVSTSLLAFAVIRVKNNPRLWQRKSRFYESHMGPAYLILFMIFGVVASLLALNASRQALGVLPYSDGAFLARPLGNFVAGLISHSTLEIVEYGLLMLHVGIVAVFLIVVLNSKHLHIFTSPLNVLFGRQPLALGRLRPLHIDIEEMDENTKIGAGVVEDLEWKHFLDMLTCTECGRCQSVCPAWNTGKELNPKLLVMNLRDHAMAKGPVLTGAVAAENATGEAKVACEQSLVGDVITPEVLWACVTCGACVYVCPVEIEHV
jgi:ferredoxin